MRVCHSLSIVAALTAGAAGHAAELRVPEDFPSVQAAIDSAVAGDVVSIAAGTYGAIDLQSKAIALHGRGKAADTIIDAGGASRVIEASGVAKGVVDLRNLTIANGFLDGTDGATGAGIRAAGTSLALTNVIVRDCTIVRAGSGPEQAFGAGVFASDRPVLIDNCRFLANTITFNSDGSLNPLSGGGALACINSQVDCTGSIFELNNCSTTTFGGSWQNVYAWGGGGYLWNCSAGFTGCSFNDNVCNTTNVGSGVAAALAGGGAIFAQGSTLAVEGCSFARNRASTSSVTTYSVNYNNALGGAIWFRLSSSDLSVGSSEFESNSCSASLVRPGVSGGGAVHVEGATAQIAGATFVTNETVVGPLGGQVFGGAVGVDGGNVAIVDSLLCANDAPQSGIRASSSSATIAIPPSTCVSGLADCAVCAPPCPADLAADGAVNGMDVTILLNLWGSDGSAYPGVDIDGDGVVGATDLAILLNAWGPCPE